MGIPGGSLAGVGGERGACGWVGAERGQRGRGTLGGGLWGEEPGHRMFREAELWGGLLEAMAEG